MHGVDDDIHVTAELGSFCFGCGDRKAMNESFRLLEGGNGRFTTKNMFRMLGAVVDIICWLCCVTRGNTCTTILNPTMILFFPLLVALLRKAPCGHA